MGKALTKVLGAVAIFFALLTAGSLLGRFYWLLDVLSHYHLQYTVALTICLLALVRGRGWRWPLLFPLGALLVNVYLVAPLFWPAPTAQTPASTATPLRVMTLNISTSNQGYTKVIALIQERQPDLVFMSEVRADLLTMLRAALSSDYPYLHAEPSRMTLGIALLSRSPFAQVETVTMNGRGRRYLRAQLDWQGQPITVVGIHPLPPMRAAWAAQRNQEIALMGEIANTTAEPFILLGDLNASPWSTPMRRLMASSDLRYALQGYGAWPTWRLAGVVLGAPLDYVLISPQWQVVNYREAGEIGSDHIPVQADLRLGDTRLDGAGGR